MEPERSLNIARMGPDTHRLPCPTSLPVRLTRPIELWELGLQSSIGPLQDAVLDSPMPCRTMAPNITPLKRPCILLVIRPVQWRCVLNTASRNFLTRREGPRSPPTTPTAPSSPLTFLRVKHLYRIGTTIELVVASVPIATSLSEGE